MPRRPFLNRPDGPVPAPAGPGRIAGGRVPADAAAPVGTTGIALGEGDR